MKKSVREIRSLIKRRVKEKSLKAITERVKIEKPKLWGMEKGKYFLSHSVFVSLYKDLYDTGYCELKKEVGSWLKITEKSFSFNQKKLREVFSQWGMEHVQSENYSDWEGAKKNIKFRKPVKSLQLFMDSTDIAITGKRTTSRKDSSWSYKENSPAQRFMMICDAKTRVRYLKGGYTPKLFDGHFLKLHHEELEEKFKDTVIGANQHFEYGAKNFRKIEFIVPVKAPSKKKSKKNKTTKNVLCKKHTIHNQRLAAARARVIKTKFCSLSALWKEDLEQQDHLVRFAIGLHNYEL